MCTFFLYFYCVGKCHQKPEKLLHPTHYIHLVIPLPCLLRRKQNVNANLHSYKLVSFKTKPESSHVLFQRCPKPTSMLLNQWDKPAYSDPPNYLSQCPLFPYVLLGAISPSAPGAQCTQCSGN